MTHLLRQMLPHRHGKHLAQQSSGELALSRTGSRKLLGLDKPFCVADFRENYTIFPKSDVIARYRGVKPAFFPVGSRPFGWKDLFSDCR